MVNNVIRMGFTKITVIDFDRVSESNLSTQLWGRRDIGQLKVVALKNMIFNSVGITITDIPRKLEISNVGKLLKRGSLVIDGFDNYESRALVAEHCKEFEIECLHVGLAQDFSEITWNNIYKIPKVTKGLDVCEYPLARNIVMMSVVVGTESIVRYLDTGAKESYFITLGDLKILPR
jgi:tRNA A37 threonylcarbamoyladenosine dehydratase